MDSKNASKLNQLLQAWPQGTVAVSPWLKKQGVYQQLAWRYQQYAWLQSLGRGAYVRSGDKVEWPGGLYALQRQLKLPVHAGGKTALELHGYSHFVPARKGGKVLLFGRPGRKLPNWFLQHEWGVQLHYYQARLFKEKKPLGLSEHDFGSFAIRVSCPERAVMELLYLVPQAQSFEEGHLLMEGLTTLRPQLVQQLLQTCRSFKVKRLFLFLAEMCNHPWVGRLDLKKVKLGRGKRVVVSGGKFDAKYGITFPAALAAKKKGSRL